jgi:hypothetical protein
MLPLNLGADAADDADAKLGIFFQHGGDVAQKIDRGRAAGSARLRSAGRRVRHH